MQDILLDRRKVYQQLQVSLQTTSKQSCDLVCAKIWKGACQLQKSGIPVPLHIIVDRDSLSGDEKDPDGFVETEDYVELNGMVTSY